MFKMSAFSFNACTKTGESYLLFTRCSGYILEVRCIHLWSSDVTFLRDSVYQKLLKSVYFSFSYFKKSSCYRFFKTRCKIYIWFLYVHVGL